MSNIIVVGAGFSGAYIARNLAEKGHKIRVVDKRPHIAGNMYDKTDENTGCLYHKYGPHIFHTNDTDIWNWVNKFSEFTPFDLRTTVYFGTQADWFTCSFGFHTIEKLFAPFKATELIETLQEIYPNRETVTIPELLDSKSKLVREFAEILWNEDYKLYTAKQWGMKPEAVDKNILKRVPVYLSYFDKIHNKKYEAVPTQGYTKMFGNILNHENITLELGIEATDKISFKEDKVFYENKETLVIFTGAIDELFDYEYGPLKYRSLIFRKTITKNELSKPGEPCVRIYPEQKYAYTRITDYGKLPIQDIHLQVSIEEYPLDFILGKKLERYYPLSTQDDKNTFEKYKEKSKKYKNLYLTGRLANYKYYDMDQAIISARETLQEILEEV